MKFALPALLLGLAACTEVAPQSTASQKAFQPGAASVPGATVQRVGNTTVIIGTPN